MDSPKQAILLQNWDTCPAVADPYTPPEHRGLRVRGNLSGHEHFAEGTHIVTSPVLSVEGRHVTTRNGTVYLLGEPDPAFVAWCREQGKTIDPERPIKVLG